MTAFPVDTDGFAFEYIGKMMQRLLLRVEKLTRLMRLT